MMASPSKVAIAYIAANINEYHGMNVECDKLMEELGLRETAQSVPETVISLTHPPAKPEADLQVFHHQSVENAQNLLAVIYEIKSGFDQLPFFVRPIANRASKLKTGASVKDWDPQSTIW